MHQVNAYWERLLVRVHVTLKQWRLLISNSILPKPSTSCYKIFPSKKVSQVVWAVLYRHPTAWCLVFVMVNADSCHKLKSDFVIPPFIVKQNLNHLLQFFPTIVINWVHLSKYSAKQHVTDNSGTCISIHVHKIARTELTYYANDQSKLHVDAVMMNAKIIV